MGIHWFLNYHSKKIQCVPKKNEFSPNPLLGMSLQYIFKVLNALRCKQSLLFAGHFLNGQYQLSAGEGKVAKYWKFLGEKNTTFSPEDPVILTSSRHEEGGRDEGEGAVEDSGLDPVPTLPQVADKQTNRSQSIR